VHGIVQRLGGTILAESKFGKGSTFRVYLPISAGEAESAAPAVPAGRHSGTGRILFVDDDPSIAEIGGLVLTSFGYRTTVLTSSTEAREVLRADPGTFDLLITDLDMPGISGLELIAEVRALRPGLPVILCTGLAEFADSQKAAQLKVNAIVLKPFRQADLAESIETVLRKGGA
jgi:CheY-like chemotaxis protein